jgi:hypothetical protein
VPSHYPQDTRGSKKHWSGTECSDYIFDRAKTPCLAIMPTSDWSCILMSTRAHVQWELPARFSYDSQVSPSPRQQTVCNGGSATRDRVMLTDITGRMHKCYQLLPLCRGRYAVTHPLDSCLQWRPCSSPHVVLPEIKEISTGKMEAYITYRQRSNSRSKLCLHFQSIFSLDFHYYLSMPGGPRPPPEVIASWPPANLVNPEGRGTVTSVIALYLQGCGFDSIYSAMLVGMTGSW